MHINNDMFILRLKYTLFLIIMIELDATSTIGAILH